MDEKGGRFRKNGGGNRQGPKFGIDKPAIPGPGRPRLSEDVKTARSDARKLLKEKAYWMAERILELAEDSDPDVAIKALKIGIDKVLPNLEEVETHDDRPLQRLTDEQVQRELELVRSRRNGTHTGNGAAA